MAKLHFFYSVMNAGKSTALLQAAHNYESKGWKVLYFTSGLDNRDKVGYISSRVGISKEAASMNEGDRFENWISDQWPIVIFVDEIQFFTDSQIEELAWIADYYEIPVLCYGLKNNSNAELFGPAIIKLMALADQIKELKTVCRCGAKATQILRYSNGVAVITEDVVEPGAEETYESVCRPHWNEAFN